MGYFLRKAIVDRVKRNRVLYIMWGEEFKTFEDAKACRAEFQNGDCFDILRNHEVLVKHTRAYNTGVYNKIEKRKYAFKNSEDRKESD